MMGTVNTVMDLQVIKKPGDLATKQLICLPRTLLHGVNYVVHSKCAFQNHI